MKYGLVRTWPWWKDALLLIALALFTVTLAHLAGCATAERDPRDDAFDQHLAVLGADMDAGKITRKQAAVSAQDKARELFNDPHMNELWAYRVMLADRVEAGQTTLAQAGYLDERKVSEITERLKAAPSGRPPTFRPDFTCRPDGYGAVRCR